MPSTHFNEVYSGAYIDLMCPSVDDIHIVDIAHHLSNIGRANGAFSEFYSVAEHSVLVARMMKTHGGDARMQLAGLLHDGHEAYVGDITRPAGDMLEELAGQRVVNMAKATFDHTICTKFNIPLEDMQSPGVRHWDLTALAIEAFWLLPSRGKGEQWQKLPQPSDTMLKRYKPACQMPRVAKLAFLNTFKSIVATGLEDGIAWSGMQDVR